MTHGASHCCTKPVSRYLAAPPPTAMRAGRCDERSVWQICAAASSAGTAVAGSYYLKQESIRTAIAELCDGTYLGSLDCP
jgi:hypothetical protein